MNLDVDIYLKQGRFLLNAQFRCRESAAGVFGPSGCGKSTLFRALAGLVRPQRGHIVLDGQTLFDAERRIFIKPHERNIGLVFQDARLFPHWSVEQNLRAGECVKQRIAGRPFGFDDVVSLLDIGQLIDRSVDQLSGGERQRIAIGRTLLAHPRLLLMDEPIAGLDPSLKMQILPFLARVHRALKIPAILISHDLGDILQLTDQLLLLRNGLTAGYGSLEELVQNPATLRELKGTDLTNLIRARVNSHDQVSGTTLLNLPDAPDQTIRMQLDADLNPGAEINMGIAANQITLANRRIDGISMRNQFPGRVIKIIHASDRSICYLETEAGTLFAEITPGTEQELKLTEGSSTWVLFKSMAIQQL